MKWFAISLCLVLSLHVNAAAVSTDSLSDVDTRQKSWSWLVPSHIVVQNAGNMGLFSAGVGWGYGEKKQWETQLLIGFLPKNEVEHAKPTFTLKQNFIPWDKPIAPRWHIEPLTCSCYVNTIASSEFWGVNRKKYPNNYYRFATQFTTSIALGQRVTYLLAPEHGFFVKSVTAFYEVSACDVGLIDWATNKSISLWETLGLSLGLRLQIK